MSTPGVPTSDLPPEEKAKRSGSFGAIATDYDRFRPGPPLVAVEWMLPDGANTVIDLGAGTGGLTRVLIDRIDHVIAVEPDDRMRAVLVERVPYARAVNGRGNSMPLPDDCADALLASSSWHWMDVEPTLREVARVPRPGGTIGAVWAGPDNESDFMAQAHELLAPKPQDGDGPAVGSELAKTVLEEGNRPLSGLSIPDGLPFAMPEYEVFRWEVPHTADDLVGLLGTFSWIITMDEERRQRLFDDTRRLLRDALGVEGDVTVDVTYRADTYRSRCTA